MSHSPMHRVEIEIQRADHAASASPLRFALRDPSPSAVTHNELSAWSRALRGCARMNDPSPCFFLFLRGCALHERPFPVFFFIFTWMCPA